MARRCRIGPGLVESLAIDEESALHVARLPSLHRDPFDRLLIAQALVHGLTILTPDPLISPMPLRVSCGSACENGVDSATIAA